MPICNDSIPNVGVGYSSFDDYNEAHPFEEPIEAHHFQKFYKNETNYEPPEVIPHGTYMKIEWKVAGSKDYSIQIISIMMSSTSNHVAYKSAIVMSKKELKTILGMLALKEKFEYKIRNSSKTLFKVLCKYIGCKLQLHAFGM